MATKIYLPSSGAPDVTPSTWVFTNQSASAVSYKGVLTKISSAFTSLTEGTTTTNPFTKARMRYIIGPLNAQTISGTVRMVMRMQENNAGANANLRMAVKIIQSSGADRATLLGETGSDSATSPYELTTTLASKRCWTATETEPLSLTSQSASQGDYLVIEIGQRSATSTNRTITYEIGDNSANNLTYGDDETNQYCGWVEFSQNLFPTDIAANKAAFVQGKTNVTPASKSAYIYGVISSTSNKSAYISGIAISNSNKSAFVQGSTITTSSKSVYIKGKADDISNKSAYLQGVNIGISNKSAYISGYSAGGDVSNSHNAFVLGLDNGLVPDGDLIVSGVWWNELNSPNNLYQSINEYPTPNDNNFIWNTNPISGYYYECSLTNPSGIPGTGDVIVFWRGKDKSNSGKSKAHIEIKQGVTIIASGERVLTSTPTTYYFTLTPSEKSNITDWNDLKLRVTIIIL